LTTRPRTARPIGEGLHADARHARLRAGRDEKTFTSSSRTTHSRRGRDAHLRALEPSGTTLGAPAGRRSGFNADFFVRQHYHDFLNREPDAPASPSGRARSTRAARRAVPRGQAHQRLGGLLPLHRVSGDGLPRLPHYKAPTATRPRRRPGTVPVIRLNEFLPDTQRIGQGVVVGQGNWQAQLEANKQAYALEFVQRQRFLTAFPVLDDARAVRGQAQPERGRRAHAGRRDQLVAQLNANGEHDVAAGRASVLRKRRRERRAPAGRVAPRLRADAVLRLPAAQPDDAPEPTSSRAGSSGSTSSTSSTATSSRPRWSRRSSPRRVHP
jgi:hypothetical protein